MHSSLFFFTLLSLMGASIAAPKRDATHTDCPDSDADHTSTFGGDTSIPSATWTAKDVCAKGGVCDCSRIKDKNSEEYFQCITNANCERCWVSRTTTSTTTTTTKKTSTPFANTTLARTDFHTMSPGTYTITQNNTVLNIVVTQQTPTVTSSTMVYVTMTQTVVVTVAPETQSAGSSDETASASSTRADDCNDDCDCSQIDDKDSKEYFECLTDPRCERCRTTATSSSSSASATERASSTSTDTAPPTTTSSSPASKETCPDYCDCSDLDQESEEYFQCVTNPVCEKCQTGK